MKGGYLWIEVFPLEVRRLMRQQKKGFMRLIDTKEILVDSEVDKWNFENGALSDVDRVMYYLTKDNGVEFYRVKPTRSAYTIIVPNRWGEVNG